MILQDANIVNKNRNIYTEESLKKSVGNRINPFKFNNWQEVTKEQIDIAMLMPGEYKEKDGKFYIKPGMLDGYICDEFYKEETKTIVVNDAIDLFPEDPDFNIEAPEIDWVMDQPTDKINPPQNKLTDYDKVGDAKKIMREAFASDEQFKWGYILNVAMHLHSELCKDDVKLKVERRNEIAEKLLKAIFYMGEE